jgi:short-subunit dehydrogenase
MWARVDEISDLSIFRKLMEVNYLGVVHSVHAGLPALRRVRGTIVAVSSLQGIQGIPNHSGYSASKHAVNGFLDSLELELGNQIRILRVLPGWIKGTNLRASAFVADGSQGGLARKHSRDAVSVKACSQLILGALAKGRHTLFVPAKLRLVPWLRLLAPGLLRRAILKAVRQQQPPSPGSGPQTSG